MLDKPEARARLRRKLEQWPEGRGNAVNVNEGLWLLAMVESLQKEADWLAANLSECVNDDDLPFCPYHINRKPASCDYRQEDAEEAAYDGELPCTHRQKDCWREAARKAVEEKCSQAS